MRSVITCIFHGANSYADHLTRRKRNSLVSALRPVANRRASITSNFCCLRSLTFATMMVRSRKSPSGGALQSSQAFTCLKYQVYRPEPLSESRFLVVNQLAGKIRSICMKRLFFWLALIPGIILWADPSFALSWAKVPGGAPVANDSAIYGVVVLGDADVWAVGSVAHQPLTEHWDGAVWTVVRGPHLEFGGQFHAVAARSANDIWAVGESDALGQVHTLVEHWDGSRWVVFTSPNVGTYDQLNGVAVISRDDVWAVGYSISPTVRYILNALGRRGVVIGGWTGSQRGCALRGKGLRRQRCVGRGYRGLFR